MTPPPPRHELVEASGKECFVGRWLLHPFIFHLYEHLNGEKEKWQHYEALTSGSCELCSLYTNLTRMLALHWCFTVIRVSLTEMHCMKRMLAMQTLLAGA